MSVTLHVKHPRAIDEIRYPPCWPFRGGLRMKFPDIAPPPKKKLRNIGGADPGTLRYINNNAL